MQPYNPYVPPAAAPAMAQTPIVFRARGTGIKWLYLTVALVRFLAQLGIHLAAAEPLLQAFASVAYAVLLLFLVGLAGGWIYTAWGDIPPDDRQGTSPDAAVAKLFIPFYNLYWMFAVSTGLCGVLNLQLARRGAAPKVHAGLAIFGCVTYLVGGIFGLPGLEVAGAFVSLLTAGVWFVYMFECDNARRFLAQEMVA